MSNYFENFPRQLYKFGDAEDPVYFQKLAKYVDLVDRVADDASTYIEYEILDFDRPDTLAHKLYGTSEYEWTFFSMNARLRESGWPMTLQGIGDYAIKKAYPNYVCQLGISIPTVIVSDSAELGYVDSDTARVDVLAKHIAIAFPVGQTVTIGNFYGEVLDLNIQNAEVTIGNVKDSARSTTFATGDSVAGQAVYLAPTTITYGTDDIATIAVNYPIVYPDTIPTVDSAISLNEMLSVSTKYEYEGTHHFTDSVGEIVDYLFFAGAKTGISNIDWLIAENDKSKRIRVIKNQFIDKIVGEHKRLTAR